MVVASFKLFAVFGVIGLAIYWLYRVYEWVWVSPKKLEKILRAQGFKGNPYRLIWGDQYESEQMIKAAMTPIRLEDDFRNRTVPHLLKAIQTHDPPGCFVWVSIPEEAEALFQWKITSGNKNNPFLTSWHGFMENSSHNPCTWFGVSCDTGSNHITGLNLTNSSIRGTLFNFHFSSLPNLEYLDLSYNQLSGPVPKELSNLTLLTVLDLASNRFAGPIPDELGYLTQLHVLDLGINQINGFIPKSLGNLTNLTFLAACLNQLSGSIPEELGNLKMLSVLGLYGNTLSGQIPSCFIDFRNFLP